VPSGAIRHSRQSPIRFGKCRNRDLNPQARLLNHRRRQVDYFEMEVLRLAFYLPIDCKVFQSVGMPRETEKGLKRRVLRAARMVALFSVAMAWAVPHSRASADYVERLIAQVPPRPFDSRPPNAPPTPAPRSSNSGTTVLPRVPADTQTDRSRRYVPDRRLQRAPERSRVVPKPPAAGGDPAKFFDKPADNRLSCEQLRRLAVNTGRLYWQNRYARCTGAN